MQRHYYMSHVGLNTRLPPVFQHATLKNWEEHVDEAIPLTPKLKREHTVLHLLVRMQGCLVVYCVMGKWAVVTHFTILMSLHDQKYFNFGFHTRVVKLRVHWFVLSWDLCFMFSCLPPLLLSCNLAMHPLHSLYCPTAKVWRWQLSRSNRFFPLFPAQVDSSLSSALNIFLACFKAKFLLELQSFFSSTSNSVEMLSLLEAVTDTPAKSCWISWWAMSRRWWCWLSLWRSW